MLQIHQKGGVVSFQSKKTQLHYWHNDCLPITRIQLEPTTRMLLGLKWQLTSNTLDYKIFQLTLNNATKGRKPEWMVCKPVHYNEFLTKRNKNILKQKFLAFH